MGFSPTAMYSNREYSKNREYYQASLDPPFAAAFHFDAVTPGALIGTDQYKGTTRYRIITQATNETRQMSRFIQTAFSGQDHFQANFVLIVTWQDVFDKYEQSVSNCDYSQQTAGNDCKVSNK